MTEHAFPPKVADAICKVMADVPKLGKGQENKHGNYNFAGIDDFLEAVRPLCAKHGLIIAQDEESVENVNGWLMVRFSFTLAHASGETWAHRQTRTSMVNAKMGSQAFGAAQSYALKQYMRALFQIATGEKGNDADEHAPADLPDVKPSIGVRDPRWVDGPAKTRKELGEQAHKATSDLDACEDADMLAGWKKEYEPLLKQLENNSPSWWDNDERDPPGMKQRIERMEQHFADKMSFPA